jgi:hypothetical protein
MQTKSLSYWNPPLANGLAYSQEPRDGLHVPGWTFFGQVQPGEASSQLWVDDNRRRYVTIALVLATELDRVVRDSCLYFQDLT